MGCPVRSVATWVLAADRVGSYEGGRMVIKTSGDCLAKTPDPMVSTATFTGDSRMHMPPDDCRRSYVIHLRDLQAAVRIESV